MLPEGIKLRIERELGANCFSISVRKHGFLNGFLTGYFNPRSGVLKCYPMKLEPGTFSQRDLPLKVRYDEVPWAKRA